MNGKAVFSFPYSGCLYRIFGRENPNIVPPVVGHPYYESLYGENPDALAVPTTNLAILFDEVLLPPADEYFPGFSSNAGSPGTRHNEELGISVSDDWEFWKDAQRLADDLIHFNSVKEALALADLPAQGYQATHTLSQLIQQISLSSQHDAVLIAGDQVEGVIATIYDLVKQDISTRTAMTPSPQKVTINDLQLRVLGLDLNCESLSHLAAVKQDEDVRLYAIGMQSAFELASRSSDPESIIKNALRDAIRREGIAKRVKGAFETSGIWSTLAGTTVSLVDAASPPIGQLLRLIGLTSYLVRKGQGRTQESHAWFRFGAKLHEASLKYLIDN